MLASKPDIIKYIPQRFPMVMVHELIEASETHAVTRLSIEADNIFVSNKQFSESGLVENIAQTAAAQVGYRCSKKNIPVPIGYIAAVKHLKIFRLPKEGAVINTFIRITNQVLDITVAQGSIEENGELCCCCEMRIFVKTQS